MTNTAHRLSEWMANTAYILDDDTDCQSGWRIQHTRLDDDTDSQSGWRIQHRDWVTNTAHRLSDWMTNTTHRLSDWMTNTAHRLSDWITNTAYRHDVSGRLLSLSLPPPLRSHTCTHTHGDKDGQADRPTYAREHVTHAHTQ